MTKDEKKTPVFATSAQDDALITVAGTPVTVGEIEKAIDDATTPAKEKEAPHVQIIFTEETTTPI